MRCLLLKFHQTCFITRKLLTFFETQDGGRRLDFRKFAYFAKQIDTGCHKMFALKNWWKLLHPCGIIKKNWNPRWRPDFGFICINRHVHALSFYEQLWILAKISLRIQSSLNFPEFLLWLQFPIWGPFRAVLGVDESKPAFNTVLLRYRAARDCRSTDIPSRLCKGLDSCCPCFPPKITQIGLNRPLLFWAFTVRVIGLNNAILPLGCVR